MSWSGSRSGGIYGSTRHKLWYVSVIIHALPANRNSVISALKTLWVLGALDNAKNLTTLGRQMASFPVEPYLARIILASTTYGCPSEVIDIVSLLSSSSKLFLDISDQRDAITEARSKFKHPSGDHLTMLNALRSYQEIAASESKGSRKEWCRQHFVNERTFMEALKIRDQLRLTCQRVGLDWRASKKDMEEPVLRCFTAGLVQQSALLQPDGSYKQLMGGAVVKIHPGSTLCDKKVPAIIFDELVRGWLFVLPLVCSNFCRCIRVRSTHEAFRLCPEVFLVVLRRQ
jgi:HrpA-like RNA helicase